MLLIISVIVIASIVLYMGFTKTKSMNDKILMISAYVLLIGLVFKYLMTHEGFQVKMDDEEFINGVETLDAEAAEQFNNTSTTTTNSNTSTTTNDDTTTNDEETDKKSVSFNPTLVVNIPEEEENKTNNIIVNNPHSGDPFRPADELFQPSCNNREYFKETKKFNANGNKVEAFGNGKSNDPKYLPYVDNSVSGYRLYTSKDFVPGMAFIPPTEWEVPQPHKTSGDCNLVCNQTMPNTRQLPIAMMDYGTPINALELGADGLIAKREEDAPLTSVGSIMPKFEFREYVDCYKYEQPGSPGVARQTTTTTTNAGTTTTTSA